MDPRKVGAICGGCWDVSQKEDVPADDDNEFFPEDEWRTMLDLCS